MNERSQMHQAQLKRTVVTIHLQIHRWRASYISSICSYCKHRTEPLPGPGSLDCSCVLSVDVLCIDILDTGIACLKRACSVGLCFPA